MAVSATVCIRSSKARDFLQNATADDEASSAARCRAWAEVTWPGPYNSRTGTHQARDPALRRNSAREFCCSGVHSTTTATSHWLGRGRHGGVAAIDGRDHRLCLLQATWVGTALRQRLRRCRTRSLGRPCRRLGERRRCDEGPVRLPGTVQENSSARYLCLL